MGVGIYIAFEGIDGCGKTYHSGRVYRKLLDLGIDAVLVREPYYPELREAIMRRVWNPVSEALLFTADRIQLQLEIIEDALRSGKVVISDRSVYATLAYQAARGVPRQLLNFLYELIPIKPHLVILLDVPVEIALARVRESGREVTRFESMDLLERVREEYLRLASELPNKFIVVDSGRDVELVEQEVWSHVLRFLKEKGVVE
ncbi:MAG: dTMP kinase [Thermoprotei archaeon]|nr:MAG: dTMP kinase [Thermoprotei archaeon]